MARFSGGWVKFYREAVENDIGGNIHLLGLWVTLLCWATRFESKIIGKDRPIVIPPGTVVTAFSELALKFDVSKTTIHKWIHYLETRGSISLRRVTRGTLITICNWEQYQVSEETGLTPSERQVNDSCTLIGEEKNRRIEDIGNVSVSPKGKRKTTHGIRLQYPESFESLWVLYAKKGDKKKSFERWGTLKLTLDEQMNLILAIQHYQQSKPDPQFRKDFENFLASDWRVFIESPSGVCAPMSHEEKLTKGYIFEGKS